MLQNNYNKTNFYFVTLMQVFHIELHVFEVLLMQHCNMFQTHIFRENFNKVLM